LENDLEPILSICIPTYERPLQLENLLKSIELAYKEHEISLEICISDSSADDRSESIVSVFGKTLNIKYQKNKDAFGYAGNFRNCVNLATGKFVWLIGDDDLVLKGAFENIKSLFLSNPEVTFYYINCQKLDHKFIEGFEFPFDTSNLPKNLDLFSSFKYDGPLKFEELINSKVSFDFLGGMYLSIFDRRYWIENQNVISLKKYPGIQFEDLDDTFPHAKIFANSFMGKKAYFSNKPIVVTISGKREWSHFYPLVRTFRLLDLLEEYRKNGLGFWMYFKNKNATLKYFSFDLMYYLSKKDARWPELKISRYIRSGILCPNLYISLLRLIGGKIRRIFNSHE
jgi:glycosyltransferase involved in cell wall biosynthesis